VFQRKLLNLPRKGKLNLFAFLWRYLWKFLGHVFIDSIAFTFWHICSYGPQFCAGKMPPIFFVLSMIFPFHGNDSISPIGVKLSIELPSVQNGSLPSLPSLNGSLAPSLPRSLSLFHFIVGYDKNFHRLFFLIKVVCTHAHTPLPFVGSRSKFLVTIE